MHLVTEETIIHSIDLIVTLKRHIRLGSQLFLHTPEEQVRQMLREIFNE